MFFKGVTLIAVALAIQNIDCLTKLQIEEEFSPTLVRLKSVASSKYAETSKEYSLLVTQMNQHRDRTRNATTTQINKIKTIIANAKKTPNITTPALNCLKNQETAANRLSVTSLNYCISSTNTSVLANTKYQFNTIASVAGNTVYYCRNLNPLETQNESYYKCLYDKVPDLNRQINLIENKYNELSNGTLHFNIQCLSDNTGAIMGQIGVISYEINVCLFTP